MKEVSQSYLTSLWNHEAFQKNRDDNFNTLTNRYSRRFTFIVISVAIGAALFWILAGNPMRGVKAFTSVLIVACPCALALAAPFTLGTAQRILARVGVFLRNALVLERMAQVDAVVFDKTGTLTAANTNGISFVGAPLNASGGRNGFIRSCGIRRIRFRRGSARHFKINVRRTKFARSAKRPVAGSKDLLAGTKSKLVRAAWIRRKVMRRSSMRRHHGSSVCVAIDGTFAALLCSRMHCARTRTVCSQKLSADYKLALLSGDNESDRERFWNLFGNDRLMRFNQTPAR